MGTHRPGSGVLQMPAAGPHQRQLDPFPDRRHRGASARGVADKIVLVASRQGFSGSTPALVWVRCPLSTMFVTDLLLSDTMPKALTPQVLRYTLQARSIPALSECVPRFCSS